MSNLTIEERKYYLPDNFVYNTSRNQPIYDVLGKNDDNIPPGYPYFYRQDYFEEITPEYTTNGQDTFGSISRYRNTSILPSNLNPNVVAEIGYDYFISPIEAEIPTSFYNIYEQGSIGNNYIYLTMDNNDAYPTEIRDFNGPLSYFTRTLIDGGVTNSYFGDTIKLPQGNYSPNSFIKMVNSLLETFLVRALQNQNKGLSNSAILGKIEIVYYEDQRKYTFVSNLYYTDAGSTERPLTIRIFNLPTIEEDTDPDDPNNYFFSPIRDKIFNPIISSDKDTASNICLAPLGLTPANRYKSRGYNAPSWTIVSTKVFNFDEMNYFQSPRTIDLRRSTDIYCIIDQSTNSISNQPNLDDADKIFFNIEIPINFGADERIVSSLNFKPQDANFKCISKSQNSINSINFQLIDGNGTTIDLNGSDWTISNIITQQPRNTEGTEILAESMLSFLESIPAFDRGNVENVSNITQELNPAKLEEFRKRIKKLKGKITFDSILNNLQGEKSKIMVFNKNTNTTSDIPEIGTQDIGLYNIPKLDLNDEKTDEDLEKKNISQ